MDINKPEVIKETKKILKQFIRPFSSFEKALIHAGITKIYDTMTNFKYFPDIGDNKKAMIETLYTKNIKQIVKKKLNNTYYETFDHLEELVDEEETVQPKLINHIQTSFDKKINKVSNKLLKELKDKYNKK
jgi:hypothetical protein